VTGSSWIFTGARWRRAGSVLIGLVAALALLTTPAPRFTSAHRPLATPAAGRLIGHDIVAFDPNGLASDAYGDAEEPQPGG
jgi:hypothetical protein